MCLTAERSGAPRGGPEMEEPPAGGSLGDGQYQDEDPNAELCVSTAVHILRLPSGGLPFRLSSGFALCRHSYLP